MEPELAHFEGEDSRDTSNRELWGWYSYGLAAEVFTVCGVGSFLPMTLEQLAREVGVLQSDKITPCVQTRSAQLAGREDNQCIVDIFGYDINTSSFTLYSFSLAIVVQTLVLISIGSIADHGSNRKRLLLILSFAGSTTCMLFIFVYPAIYLVGLFLTIISVASLGSSFVLLNSFLPKLVANHPSMRTNLAFKPVPLDDVSPNVAEPVDCDHDSDDEDSGDDGITHDNADSADGQELLGTSREANALYNSLPQPDIPSAFGKVSPALKLSNFISAKGIGIGYAASVLVQCLGIGIIVTYSRFKAAGSDFPSTLPLRSVLLLVRSWWAAFTIPTALWLRRRPGPPLPWNINRGNGRSSHKLLAAWRYVSFAWVSLWRTVKIAFHLPEVFKFLLGWFLLSDGIATIMGTAILFARTELQLPAAAIALLSITATASGIIGALSWPRLARRFELSPISVVLSCVFLFELIPLYGLLGFIPFIKSLGFIGLQKWLEIYLLGFLLGFIMGGISSYCRSIFGSLIPPGMEAAFYALYAVTDKGSSVIGPAVVGRIIDVTGSIRMGFWFLAFLMISPVPFFWFVDVEKGRCEGVDMARKRALLQSAASSH